MEIFEAVMIAEGVDQPEDDAQFIEAWQLLIDTGTCWQLQGSFGRGATHMINSGQCHKAEVK